MNLALVADDLSVVRNIVALLLRQKGFVVVEASDGTEALEFVRKLPLRLAILDYQMPGYDGVEVARSLRDRDSSIPILIYTSSPKELPHDVSEIADIVEKDSDGIDKLAKWLATLNQG